MYVLNSKNFIIICNNKLNFVKIMTNRKLKKQNLKAFCLNNIYEYIIVHILSYIYSIYRIISK